MATEYSVIYIGAKWCVTCKTIGPQIEELCKNFAINLIKYDLDNDADKIENVDDITKVPTIRIMNNDKIIAEFIEKQVANTTNWLQNNIKLSNTDDF